MLNNFESWSDWKSKKRKNAEQKFSCTSELVNFLSQGVRAAHDGDWPLDLLHDLMFIARDARGLEMQQSTPRRAASCKLSKNGFLSHKRALIKRAGLLCKDLKCVRVVSMEEQLCCSLANKTVYTQAQLLEVLHGQKVGITPSAFESLLGRCVDLKFLFSGPGANTYRTPDEPSVEFEKGTVHGTYARCMRAIDIWQHATERSAWRQFSVKLPSLEDFTAFHSGWLWPKDFSKQPIHELLLPYCELAWEMFPPIKGVQPPQKRKKKLDNAKQECPQNFGITSIIRPAWEDFPQPNDVSPDDATFEEWRNEAAYSILMSLCSSNLSSMNLRAISTHVSDAGKRKFWEAKELKNLEAKIRSWESSLRGEKRKHYTITLFAGDLVG